MVIISSLASEYSRLKCVHFHSVSEVGVMGIHSSSSAFLPYPDSLGLYIFKKLAA